MTIEEAIEGLKRVKRIVEGDLPIAFDMGIEALEKQKNDRWIPVTERLPEDKINPLTEDFYEYPVTVEIRGKRDVRYYKFGKPIGWDEPHWFFGSGIMDDFVIAWMPLPEPYKAESEDKE